MATIVPRPGKRSGVRFTIGMALASLALASTPAIAATPAATATLHPYAAYVTEAAQRFSIPEGWIWSVMRVESRGNSRAISPVGAMGLMQIMPATWAMLSARFGLGGDAFDIRANIHAGAGRADAWLARGNRLPAETVAYVAKIAPVIGNGAAVSSIAGVVAPPPSWRNAAVFAARSGDTSARMVSAEGGPIAGASAAAAAPSNPLFVALSGGNRP